MGPSIGVNPLSQELPAVNLVSVVNPNEGQPWNTDDNVTSTLPNASPRIIWSPAVTDDEQEGIYCSSEAGPVISHPSTPAADYVDDNDIFSSSYSMT